MSHTFTPYDVRSDWGRLGHTWISIVDDEGVDQLGLVELRGLAPNDNVRMYNEEDDVYIMREDASWTDVGLELTVINEHGNPAMSDMYIGPGQSINFAPSFSYAGYTMVNGFYGTPRLIWMSMASVRQYRYGLSSRAFVTRVTSHFDRLGREDSLALKDAEYVRRHGAQFNPTPQIEDLGQGIAINRNVGIHHVTEGIGAICINANRVVGWFTPEHGMRVEQQARQFMHGVENVSYVNTSELTDFYKSTVFPARVGGHQFCTPDTTEPISGEPSGGADAPPDYDALIRRLRQSPTPRPSDFNWIADLAESADGNRDRE
jgi:hypothetical protein